MSMWVKELQFAKAKLPMFVKPSGRVMLVKDEHPLKQEVSKVVMFLGTDNSLTLVESGKNGHGKVLGRLAILYVAPDKSNTSMDVILLFKYFISL
jgi:hypothetical protein